MNGKELMESMGYVDEKYIAAAEAKPVRRIHWQPIAAAACLILVLAGTWQVLPRLKTEEAASNDAAPMVMTSGTARNSREADQGNGAAVMMATPLAEMTVQVLEWTQEGACCQVVDPGTSDFQPGDRVTVVLPEAEEAAQPEMEKAAQPAAMALDEGAPAVVYRVSFLPDGGTDTIAAAQWTRADSENGSQQSGFMGD